MRDRGRKRTRGTSHRNLKRTDRARPGGGVVHHEGASPAMLEPLEPRLLLSTTGFDPYSENYREQVIDLATAAGLDAQLIAAVEASSQAPASHAGTLTPVGSQPQGVLSGKIVYTHAGHGWTADNLGSGNWSTQRPETFEIVEDFGNQDQMSFFVDYLWNAGATIVPLRPVHHQPNEVVLDNDDAGVTFSGAWSDSGSPIFFGDAGDTPYRFASTSASETAVARFRPDIPEAGFYPIYTWVRHGSDRVDQLYRVHHSGGTTEVRVNHERVGNGWVYLGNYYLEAGDSSYVEVSNASDEAGVVIADAIRFGNGMGDIDRGGGISGFPREDEAGLYWIEAQAGQGIPSSEWRTSSSDRTATVSASPRWAEQMNRSTDGAMTDRVFLSFHSNAGGGRGAVGLHNTAQGGNTPNQFAWADLVGRETNLDMQAIGTAGGLEHFWSTRTSHAFQREFNFGEISNFVINNEFDATILETAFHDNQLDAELMRDPKVRNWIARATYQATVKYFHRFDGGQTPEALLPEPVTEVAAVANADGSVTITWDVPVVDGIGGDAATGYLIQSSSNGFGFDAGIEVAGGSTTSFTIPAEVLEGASASFFRVVATNAGGHSLPSKVVAARPAGQDAASVLLVDGFDRIDRTQNERQSIGAGQIIDRVRTRFGNTQDLAVPVAAAISAFSGSLGFDTADNDVVIAGDVNLADYEHVIWILGDESVADETFDDTEQNLLLSYVQGGGNLMVSGSEVGFDMVANNNGPGFQALVLRSDFVADDAGTNDVTGAAGSIFDGLNLAFDDGAFERDIDTPDVISPALGSQAALTYTGGSGAAAIQFDGGFSHGNVVYFGFPFEAILGQSSRQQTLARVLEFFGETSDAPPAPTGLAAQAVNGAVLLSWQPTDNPDVVGYNVLRATSPAGPFTTLNGVTLPDTLFLDSAVTNGTEFFYAVQAVVDDAPLSPLSAQVAATPQGVGQAVFDNDDGSPVYVETGGWTTSGSTGFNGGTYRFATAGDAATAAWNFTLPAPGAYDVSVFYRAGDNRASSVRYDVQHADGTSVRFVNQQLNNLTPVSLGTFQFDQTGGSLRLDAANSTGGSVVIADAVLLTAEAGQLLPGDVDGNGLVDLADRDAFIAALAADNDADAFLADVPGGRLDQADMNQDGSIDNLDVVWFRSALNHALTGDASLASASAGEPAPTAAGIGDGTTHSDAPAQRFAAFRQQRTARQLGIQRTEPARQAPVLALLAERLYAATERALPLAAFDHALDLAAGDDGHDEDTRAPLPV